MPTMTQLEYVLAVDTHRHFSKAARACFVTQPTLSMQLHKLEDEIGVVIFDRSKKPILPTEAGKIVIKQARLVLSEFKKIQMLTDQTKKEVSGDFVLAVIPTLAPSLVPLFVRTFSERFPKVMLTVREMQTQDIIAALDREEIDASLLATPLHVKTLTEDVLFYEPFYLLVHQNHPLARKKTVKESDLEGADVLLLEEGHCLGNQIMNVCDVKVRRPVMRNVRFESGSLETLIRLVEGNVGYTLIPALDGLHRESRSARRVPFAKPVPSREVSLVYRRDQLKRPVLEALKTTITESLPPEIRKIRKKDLEVIEID